jgi:hypothetical protein
MERTIKENFPEFPEWFPEFPICVPEFLRTTGTYHLVFWSFPEFFWNHENQLGIGMA